MSLSQDQIDFYWQNGYLPVGKILEDAELEILRREYDAEFAKADADGSYTNLAEDNTNDAEKKRSAPVRMLQITQMCQRNVHFARQIYHGKMLDMVADLMGANIMLFHDQALFKPAHTGGPVYWHQDNAYWKCRPANLVSCWMTLDPAYKENGAMQVIPGSHLKPVWHETSNSSKSLLDLQEKIDPTKVITIDLPAGGAMFHHCQTLHYTQPNTTPQQRRAFITHFMPPGTRDRDGKVLNVSYHHPMLRATM